LTISIHTQQTEHNLGFMPQRVVVILSDYGDEVMSQRVTLVLEMDLRLEEKGGEDGE